jgi:hypothetical protein
VSHPHRMMKSHSDPWSPSLPRSPGFQLEPHFIPVQNHEQDHLLGLSIAQPGPTLSQNLAAAPTAYQPPTTLDCLLQALAETDSDQLLIIAISLAQLEATNHIHVSQQLHNSNVILHRHLLPDLVNAKFPVFGATVPLLIPSMLEFSDLSSILSECYSDHDSVFTRSIVVHLSGIPLSWHKCFASFGLFEDLRAGWKYSNGSWPSERLWPFWYLCAFSRASLMRLRPFGSGWQWVGKGEVGHRNLEAGHLGLLLAMIGVNG